MPEHSQLSPPFNFQVSTLGYLYPHNQPHSFQLADVDEAFYFFFLFDGVKTCVRTGQKYSSYFEIEVALYQGSALSPYLFITILDAITEEMHREGH